MISYFFFIALYVVTPADYYQGYSDVLFLTFPAFLTTGQGGVIVKARWPVTKHQWIDIFGSNRYSTMKGGVQ